MTVRRLALALFALLGVPAFAAAGPIEFRYTATGGPILYPGQGYLGELWFSLTPEGEVRFPASGGSIELGAVELQPSSGPRESDSYTAYIPFEVSVTISNAATSPAHTLVLAGGAVDTWDYRSWDGRWTNPYHKLELGDSFQGNASETSAVFGDTRYTLSVRPENDNQVGVYTLSATVLNPEPGTFALAALGLAPLGVRALRRRSRSLAE